MSNTASDTRDSQQGGARGGVSVAAPELSGDLRCRRCLYNLRGLSIRSLCPECGLPIRVTLLAVVDPRAKELQAIHLPRLTAVGLIAWTHAALLCAIVVGVLRAQYFGLLPRIHGEAAVFLRDAVSSLAGLSAIGALALVAPQAGLTKRERFTALFGVLATVLVAFSLHRIHAHIDPTILGEAVDVNPRTDRTLWKLLSDVSLCSSLLLLRPNARLLAARSVLMRTGQVNRQTLASLAAVAGVCIAGDLLLLVAGAQWSRDLLESAARWIGQSFVLVGSGLLLAGFVGLAVDVWRLLPVILERPLHIDDVVQREADA